MASDIDQYQRAFAGLFDAGHAFAFWKGRVGLYAVLRALGVGPGDEVILPGYTCVMNVNPVKYVGAVPVYVDIEPSTFNLSPALLEEKITDRTKVIIAQHTYGYPCDMDAIAEIADRNGVSVIEDCCLALGSKYKGRLAGTLGRAAYFSFQWNKPYTTGLGGMVVTGDERLAGHIEEQRMADMCRPSLGEGLALSAQRLVYRSLVYPRTTAFAQSVFRYLTRKGVVVGSSDVAEFVPTMAEDFFKGCTIAQARSGLRQLQRVQDNISHRVTLAEMYDDLLARKDWKGRDYDPTAMTPVMVRYPVRVREKEEALAQAARSGIELGSWFECPIHPIETRLAAYDYRVGMCPQAEKAAAEVVNLPLHPRVDARTARRTVDFVTRFMRPD